MSIADYSSIFIQAFVRQDNRYWIFFSWAKYSDSNRGQLERVWQFKRTIFVFDTNLFSVWDYKWIVIYVSKIQSTISFFSFSLLFSFHPLAFHISRSPSLLLYRCLSVSVCLVFYISFFLLLFSLILLWRYCQIFWWFSSDVHILKKRRNSQNKYWAILDSSLIFRLVDLSLVRDQYKSFPKKYFILPYLAILMIEDRKKLSW